MPGQQKEKRVSKGDPFRPSCDCKACDRNACPHIKKHDCLHLTENKNLKNKTKKCHITKGGTSNSLQSSNSNSLRVPSTQPVEGSCGRKKQPVDLSLLDGIKQEGCSCEVVARAIASNPRHLGLTTLRESINEGKLPAPVSEEQTEQTEDTNPT